MKIRILRTEKVYNIGPRSHTLILDKTCLAQTLAYLCSVNDEENKFYNKDHTKINKEIEIVVFLKGPTEKKF
jgi:hypothetical protein